MAATGGILGSPLFPLKVGNRRESPPCPSSISAGSSGQRRPLLSSSFSPFPLFLPPQHHPLTLFSPLPSFSSLFSSLSSSFLLPLPFSIFFLDSTGRRNVPPVCVACLNVNDGHGSCVYRRRFGSLGRR